MGEDILGTICCEDTYMVRYVFGEDSQSDIASAAENAAGDIREILMDNISDIPTEVREEAQEIMQSERVRTEISHFVSKCLTDIRMYQADSPIETNVSLKIVYDADDLDGRPLHVILGCKDARLPEPVNEDYPFRMESVQKTVMFPRIEAKPGGLYIFRSADNDEIYIRIRATRRKGEIKSLHVEYSPEMVGGKREFDLNNSPTDDLVPGDLDFLAEVQKAIYFELQNRVNVDDGLPKIEEDIGSFLTRCIEDLEHSNRK